jgi:hypothetical protein
MLKLRREKEISYTAGDGLIMQGRQAYGMERRWRSAPALARCPRYRSVAVNCQGEPQVDALNAAALTPPMA